MTNMLKLINTNKLQHSDSSFHFTHNKSNIKQVICSLGLAFDYTLVQRWKEYKNILLK